MWNALFKLAAVAALIFVAAQDDPKPDPNQGGRKHKGRGKKSKRKQAMADRKVVFVAFAIEDERQRDFLKGQSLHTRCPFEYTDMSVKEAYDTNWKDRVRTRIRRSDGVIVLVSKNSATSSGQKWEIQCAREEKKKVLGVWAYTNDRTNIDGVRTIVWSWPGIQEFIDSL